MSRLEITLSVILTLSVLINIGIGLYTRLLIINLLSVSEELGDLQIMAKGFSSHLKSVYELETFYGDDTLKRLLDHAISFDEQMKTFEFIINLTEEDQETDDDYTNESEDEASAQNE